MNKTFLTHASFVKNISVCAALG